LRAEYKIKASLPIVSWTGWTLNQRGLFEFNLNDLPKEQKTQILRVVRNILIGIIGTGDESEGA
jgi:hypothetical protein